MAGYGTVPTYAEILRRDGLAKILQATRQEENGADNKLTKLAQQINVQAKRDVAAQGALRRERDAGGHCRRPFLCICRAGCAISDLLYRACFSRVTRGNALESNEYGLYAKLPAAFFVR